MSMKLTFVLLTALMLGACGGQATSITPVPGVETLVAEAILTMTADAPVSQATGTESLQSLPATVTPVDVIPAGIYGPAAETCAFLRIELEQILGVESVLETIDFNDLLGGNGSACRIRFNGNGVTFGTSGPADVILERLHALGWADDDRRGAAGPTGMMSGHTRGAEVGILTVSWSPSAEANCPADQPISTCVLAPEQKLFEISFDIARIVVYLPLPAEQCAGWLASLQPLLPVPLVTETVAFRDLAGEIGTACRLRAVGTGMDFDNIATPADNLGQAFVLAGWELENGADGPTGTMRQYAREDMVAIITVSWNASMDSNCSTNKPLSSCPLGETQKLFTISIDLAQK